MSTVASVGTPAAATLTTGTSITAVWGSGQSRTAGNLLVGVVLAGNSAAGSTAITEGSGTWTLVAAGDNVSSPPGSTGSANWAVFAKDAAGSDAAPSFSLSAGSTGTKVMQAILYELSGAAPAAQQPDTSGHYSSGSSTSTVTVSVTTAAAPSASGGFAIAAAAQDRSAAAQTWTDSASPAFTADLSGNGTSSQLAPYAGELANPATSGTVTDSGSFSFGTTAFGAAGLVVFRAATPFTGSGSDQASGGTALNGTSTPKCTLPSGIQSGDVIILDVLEYNTTVTTWPSGFTQQLVVSSAGGITMKRYVATKLADGSEGGTVVTITLGATSWGTVLSYVLRGLSSATPAHTGSATTSTAVTALGDPSLTVSGSTDITVWGYGGTNSSGSGAESITSSPAALSNFTQEGQTSAGATAGIGWQTGGTAPGGATASSAIFETDWALDFPLAGGTPVSDSDASTAGDAHVIDVSDARRRV